MGWRAALAGAVLAFLPCAAFAQGGPQPPIGPTSYDQCADYSQAANSHWQSLSNASLACVRSLTMAEMTGPSARGECGAPGGAPRCQPQSNAASFFHQQRMANFNQCRANVRVFLEGKEAARRKVDSDPFRDYSQELRDDYGRAMFGGLADLAIGKSINRWVPELRHAKDAYDRFSTFRDIFGALTDRSPAAILNMGKTFAGTAFGRVPKSELSGLLFDASSSAVAATGQRGTEDLFAALTRFNNEAFKAVQPLVGVPTIQSESKTAASTSKAGKAGTGGASQSNKSCSFQNYDFASQRFYTIRLSPGQSYCDNGALMRCSGGQARHIGNCG
jgi:hypothetical protein